LLITENGVRKTEGYSPFTAKEYKLESPYQKTTDPEKAKDATE
jgi:hypothetical protein